MKKLVAVFFLLILFGGMLIAQPPVEAQARAELERRGLDEDVIRQRMLLKGIDIDKIDKNSPSEVLAAEKALEEVIKELEAEKGAAQQAPPQPKIEAEGIELSNPAIRGVDVSEAVRIQRDTTEKAIEEIKNRILRPLLPKKW
jgi:hypothetical protein